MKYYKWCACILVIWLISGPLSAAPGATEDTPGAHAFALHDAGGELVRLEDFQGKKVVMVFWAFWCWTWKDCREILSSLSPLREEYNFQIVAISIDARWKELALPFIENGEITYPLLMDEGGRTSARYEVSKVPTFIVLSADHKVLHRSTGIPGRQKVDDILRLLRE